MVLLLDNDEVFRTALAEMLRDDGHEVLEYAAPSEVPRQTIHRATVLVTHCRMASSAALAFADRFRAAHPAAPVIATTSYSTASLEAEVAARPCMHLLRKPMDYAAIAALLE